MATLHIGGLSSGYDYAGMIESLMEARRVPIDSQQTKLEELDYDLGAWSTINEYSTNLTATLDTLRGYELWRDMFADSSNSSVVTATAAIASNEQSYNISVSNLAKAQSISSDRIDTTDDLVTAGLANEGDVFTIEGQEIAIEAGETLSTLRTKINSAALSMDEATRVQASIVDNHLVVTREQTGAGSIALSDTTGTVLQNLGLLESDGITIKNEDVAGVNANFTVNGIAVSRSSNSNLTDVVEGLTLDLRGVGASTLDIHPDREAIKTAILDFVEKYNTLATLVDDCTTIELGSSSELAQKGELYGDNLVNSMRLDLRRQATDIKDGVLTAENASFTYAGQTGIMDNLSDIGIWTSGESNQLQLVDEKRLDFLLEHEFDKVSQLFKGVFNETEVSYEGGIAVDFYKYADNLSSPMTGNIAKHIQSMTENYDDMSDRIKEMEDELAKYEQDLWDEFTAMEDALAEMKQQTEYIKGMFSSGDK